VTIAAGTRLGRYEIRSKIGAGGMGEVYLGEDCELHRSVALKVLPSDAYGPSGLRLAIGVGGGPTSREKLRERKELKERFKLFAASCRGLGEGSRGGHRSS